MNEEQTQKGRIKILLKKTKGLLKDKQQLARFKEPVLILLRTDGTADFYENEDGRTAGTTFMFEHTDGKEKMIHLNKKTYMGRYGKENFRFYVCDEDNPLPLPQKPLVTAEELGMIIYKLIHDMHKWMMEEIKGKALKGFWLWAGIIVLVIVIALFLIPAISDMFAKEAVNTIARNVTLGG